MHIGFFSLPSVSCTSLILSIICCALVPGGIEELMEEDAGVYMDVVILLLHGACNVYLNAFPSCSIILIHI